MNLVGFYPYENEAFLVARDDHGDLAITLHYERKSIFEIVFTHAADLAAGQILDQLDHSHLPETSEQKPRKFTGWVGGCLFTTILWQNSLKKNARGSSGKKTIDLFGLKDGAYAWSNTLDMLPDNEPDPKLLCMVKAKDETYYLCLFFSQIEAGTFWKSIRAPFPLCLQEELLELPVHSGRKGWQMSGDASRGLFQAMCTLHFVKEDFILKLMKRDPESQEFDG